MPKMTYTYADPNYRPDTEIEYDYEWEPTKDQRVNGEGRCQALRKDGLQCWNPVKEGKKYCHVHHPELKKEPDEIKAATKKWNRFFNG